MTPSLGRCMTLHQHRPPPAQRPRSRPGPDPMVLGHRLPRTHRTAGPPTRGPTRARRSRRASHAGARRLAPDGVRVAGRRSRRGVRGRWPWPAASTGLAARGDCSSGGRGHSARRADRCRGADHEARRAGRSLARGAPVTDLQLRASVLLGEARALGLDLADLIATLTGEAHPLAADQRRFSGTVGSPACSRR